VAVIAILVIVAISLRSGKMTLLVGAAILMLLFWMFGSTRLLDFGSSQFIDLLLPIAILSLGVDYALHSVHRYNEERERDPEPREAYKRSVRGVGPALFIAMVTTAVAFSSNAASELQAVQQFGLAAGLAIVWAYIILGLALPAMKMLPEARGFTKGREKGKREDMAGEAEASVKDPSDSKPRGVWRIVTAIGARPLVVVVVVLLVTVPLAYRGFQIEGKMPVEDFINEESDFVRSLDKMNEHFITGEEGRVLLQADFSDPENLKVIQTFHRNIADNREAIFQAEILTIYDYVYNITTNDYLWPQYGNVTLREHLGITDGDGDGLPDSSAMVERAYEFMLVEGNGLPVYMLGPMPVKSWT
jgi:predicted RND superfamily exporter protein